LPSLLTRHENTHTQTRRRRRKAKARRSWNCVHLPSHTQSHRHRAGAAVSKAHNERNSIATSYVRCCSRRQAGRKLHKRKEKKTQQKCTTRRAAYKGAHDSEVRSFMPSRKRVSRSTKEKVGRFAEVHPAGGLYPRQHIFKKGKKKTEKRRTKVVNITGGREGHHCSTIHP